VSPDETGHLIAEIEADDEADVAADMADEGSREAEQETSTTLSPNQKLPRKHHETELTHLAVEKGLRIRAGNYLEPPVHLALS